MFLQGLRKTINQLQQDNEKLKQDVKKLMGNGRVLSEHVDAQFGIILEKISAESVSEKEQIQDKYIKQVQKKYKDLLEVANGDWIDETNTTELK